MRTLPFAAILLALVAVVGVVVLSPSLMLQLQIELILCDYFLVHDPRPVGWCLLILGSLRVRFSIKCSHLQSFGICQLVFHQ